VILPDVNVLVLAHRRDHDEHDEVRSWLEDEVNSDSPFALADLTLSGFLRIVTNRRIYERPSKLVIALEFVDGLVEQPTCVPVSAGPNHWPIFRRVLVAADARGNLVPDAHLAAIAIEHGATVATRDRGFARFGDVRWLDPVA
jgi:toxin-antitoxin system PIN domain toxin